MRPRWTALIALGVAAAYVGWRLAQAGGDPLALAELATDLPGESLPAADGYDGQFAYAIALDPDPARVAPKLDVPAYRYQRILYPLLARVLAFGQPAWLPWTLLLVNLAAHSFGTWAVARFLEDIGVWPGYALTYALWVGLVAGVGLDLNEPLAYALVAGAWLARRLNRSAMSAVLMGMALFAKETSLLFWAPMLAADGMALASRRSAGYLALGGMAFAGWQIWLWSTFGVLGLGSGGAMATAFEWIPYMGLLRIGEVSLPALGLFVAIFGPTVVLPSAWGIVAGLRSLLRREVLAEAGALALNAGAIAGLPFSTFREPLGLVRFAAGLVLATLVYAGVRRLRRPLVYSLFWSALIVILLKG
jgi:hypothetical protein